MLRFSIIFKLENVHKTVILKTTFKIIEKYQIYPNFILQFLKTNIWAHPINPYMGVRIVYLRTQLFGPVINMLPTILDMEYSPITRFIFSYLDHLLCLSNMSYLLYSTSKVEIINLSCLATKNSLLVNNKSSNTHFVRYNYMTF